MTDQGLDDLSEVLVTGCPFDGPTEYVETTRRSRKVEAAGPRRVITARSLVIDLDPFGDSTTIVREPVGRGSRRVHASRDGSQHTIKLIRVRISHSQTAQLSGLQTASTRSNSGKKNYHLKSGFIHGGRSKLCQSTGRDAKRDMTGKTSFFKARDTAGSTAVSFQCFLRNTGHITDTDPDRVVVSLPV